MARSDYIIEDTQRELRWYRRWWRMWCNRNLNRV